MGSTGRSGNKGNTMSAAPASRVASCSSCSDNCDTANLCNLDFELINKVMSTPSAAASSICPTVMKPIAKVASSANSVVRPGCWA